MAEYEPHLIIRLSRARKIIKEGGLVNKKEMDLLIDEIDKLVVQHRGL